MMIAISAFGYLARLTFGPDEVEYEEHEELIAEHEMNHHELGPENVLGFRA
jgi:hypothetical protein